LVTEVFDLEFLQGRKNEDFFYVILGDGTYKKNKKNKKCAPALVTKL
jgi:hypothetical protein